MDRNHGNITSGSQTIGASCIWGWFFIFRSHPPRSLLAADVPTTPLFRSVVAVAAFSLAQPLRIPTETKLGGSVVAWDLELPLTLLVMVVVVVMEELSLMMNPPEAAKREHFPLIVQKRRKNTQHTQSLGYDHATGRGRGERQADKCHAQRQVLVVFSVHR